MSLLNRPLLCLISLCGISTIIGTGFCTWAFVGELVPPKPVDARASVEITQNLECGYIFMASQYEAQRLLNQEGIVDPSNNMKYVPSPFDPNQKFYFNDLNKLYNTRQIIFTEGNIDDNENGLNFYRFSRNAEQIDALTTQLPIDTFVRENIFYPYFMIDEVNQTIPSNMEFKLGAKINIGTSSINGDLGMDSFVEFTREYKNAVTFNAWGGTPGGTYLDIFNPLNAHLFQQGIQNPIDKAVFYNEFKDGIYPPLPNGATSIKLTPYKCSIDLMGMFQYLPGKKPNDIHSVREIKNAIIKNPEGWKITVDLYSTYMPKTSTI